MTRDMGPVGLLLDSARPELPHFMSARRVIREVMKAIAAANEN